MKRKVYEDETSSGTTIVYWCCLIEEWIRGITNFVISTPLDIISQNQNLISESYKKYVQKCVQHYTCN